MVDAGIYPELVRADIDLSALAHNCRELRRLTAPSATLMAVVKADGYGHGAVPVSRVALKNGADWLAVARFSEVVQLREAGIEAPVLLLGYCSPAHAAVLAGRNCRVSVASLEAARELSAVAGREGVVLRVHVKVDTGMGRLGIAVDGLLLPGIKMDHPGRALSDVLEIARLPHLEIEGIYTHFACADSADKGSAQTQLSRFQEFLEQLRKQGFECPIRHAANSAATIEMPDSHLDLVRPGIAQYGLWPSADTNRRLIDLKPVMSLKSQIVQLKDVPAGFRISYGSTYETAVPTRIATVPIGYADGYSRLLSSRGEMLVRGIRVPVVGRVCMDLTMIDVGAVDGVATGDEVVVMGGQGREEITADEIAELLSTINYEVVTSIAARVERRYVLDEGDTSPGRLARPG